LQSLLIGERDMYLREGGKAMKVLAVVGSPRKGGNTDVLIDQMIGGAAGAGAEVEKVYLNDLKITPCQACYACKKKPGCVIKDDMQKLYPKIMEAEGLLFGTPVYWWTVSAQMKCFLDRWFALLDSNYKSLVAGKRIGLAVVCQDPGTKAMTDPILHMFKEGMDFIGIKYVGEVTASCDAKGEVAQNARAMARARELGRQIAEG